MNAKKPFSIFASLFIILGQTHFVYSQDYYDKKSYYDPDSLSIVFYEGRGDITGSNSMLTVEFYNEKGEVFSYNLYCASEELYNMNEAHYLRKGNLNKADANFFVDLIFDNKINWLPLNQENTKIQINGEGEGGGKCAICIKKGSNYFLKTLTYPGSDFRILNKEFVDFKRETYLNALKLTKDIPLKELENIIFNTCQSNFPFKEIENLYGNRESYSLGIKHNAMNFAAEAIGNINDTALINDLISLFQKESLTTDDHYLCWPLMSVFKRMDNDKITNFLGSIIDDLIRNKNENIRLCSFGIIDAITVKSNVPLKTYYLKRCLLIDYYDFNVRSAMELAKLNDDAGLNILLNELNKDYFDLYGLNEAFAKFEKKSIPEIIAKYQSFKTNTTLSEEQKNNKMTAFLKLLNMLLGIDSKEKMSEYDYKANLEKEMKELDIEIEIYQAKNKK